MSYAKKNGADSNFRTDRLVTGLTSYFRPLKKAGDEGAAHLGFFGVCTALTQTMITFETAKRLVIEANADYDSQVMDGNWTLLNQARHRVSEQRGSVADVCLSTVAECRNPSPLQDINDLRKLANTEGDDASVDSLKRYFVAVYQKVIQDPAQSIVLGT